MLKYVQVKRKLIFDKNSDLYIGVGANHDFSGCIIQNGQILMAIEAERINRIKHGYEGFNTFQSVLKYLLKDSTTKINSLSSCDTLNLRNLNEYRSDIKLYNHHLCHASAVFFTSPFDKSAILITDGLGSRQQADNGIYSFETVSMYSGHGEEIKEVRKIYGEVGQDYDERHLHNLDIPNSLGIFYTYITKIIGFNFLEDGKTMGLASYGDSTKFYSRLIEHVEYTPDGSVLIKFSENDFSYYKNIVENEKDEGEKFKIKADIAAAGQLILEEILLYYTNLLQELTGEENLCLGGGVALNSLANGRILKESKFKNIHIFPACGDDSISVGAAYLSYYENKNSRVIMENINPFLGKSYSETEILGSLQKFENISFLKPEDKYEYAANLLNQSKIIAWFQGGSEFGPRSLGHRSILANPKDKNTKDYINLTIKNRELFRPFAPVILHTHQHQYFDSNFYSPSMLFVMNAIEDKTREIEAVVHVDKSSRIQSVNETNVEMYKLLTCFNKISGLPLLLNTSFNIIKGEPIVETPEDALKSFSASKLDYLILGDYICTRKI